ncbi:ribonuclease III [Williamwhitmania taraxaci]|uniref:Ribonuclease 3 n=1 Tax=Williamwhitmania taraxaci TaxID=1640674 RepID=A0A1G6KL14_9BACT|nr:ribonuclease III [Williamwhitmania taraxaci]SDC31225.1 ribonuclease-3 [Williamwhitmania taraxaci]
MRVSIIHRRRFKSVRDREFYVEFKRAIGFYPQNINLYKLAFIHKSASIVLPSGQSVNNERLEYLGDAILDAIIADFLFEQYPSEREGFLTKMRAKIVSRTHLNRLSVQMGLQRLIISNSCNSTQRHIFGDALEAFIGAMYLDKGYKKTRKYLIRKIFKKFVNLNVLEHLETDFKSRIIEWGQKHRRSVTFDYREEHEAKETSPIFFALLYIANTLAGEGQGSSKKEAEQNAAMIVLSNEEQLNLLAQNIIEEAHLGPEECVNSSL